MSMPLTYCVPGAEVEQVLDLDREKTGKDDMAAGRYYWKPAKIKRRGFIVKTKYPGDEMFSSDCVEWVEVKFEKGKPPEKCLPTQLNLIKVANEAALYALKNEANIQKVNNGLIDDIKKPIAIDRTGAGKTGAKGLSAAEAKELE